ncbi:cytochrome P450 [Allokutzneria albata]|uniref:Pentalenene oxygenase n=1 Tax=Allokutzneria albata TaxID=211114 RepID=A0A1G9VR55_ALLAB|nr:cytochrome P450 [Allokutzneria albata]SDM74583.1 pentalenene oxygenase [Allokutzneria albata]
MGNQARSTGVAVTGTAPGALPLLGHALTLLRDPLRFIGSLAEHGDLVHVRFGPLRAVVVCDPELAHQVITNERVFDKEGPLWRRAREVEGDGLITTARAGHRRRRRMVQPAFHRAKMPHYATIMSDVLADETTAWQDGEIVPVSAFALRLTSETTARVMFTDSADPEAVAGIRAALPDLVGGVFRRMLSPAPVNLLPTPANRAFVRARKRLQDSVERLIAGYRTAGERDDMMAVLLAAEHDENGTTDDEEMSALVTGLFLAGTETTSSSVSWTMHMLAEHPDVQERLRREAESVLGDRVPAYEDLIHLPYTRAVVTEVLRLYPPAWLLARVTTSRTTLGGHVLAAGMNVIYSPYLVQRRPQQYPDPERFDPGRWLNAASGCPGSFLTFGEGARKCAGDTFALTQLMVVATGLVRRWELRPVPGPRKRPRARAVLHPRRLRLRLDRRGAA